MSETKIKLSVVVPVYNEEDAIRPVIENIIASRPKLLRVFPKLSAIEVLLVNDGSHDTSVEVMDQSIRDEKGLEIISHSVNRGYGAALQTGFERASGDIIVFFDGDGTFDFMNAKILLDEFFASQTDMITGCRFTDVSKMPLIRKIGNKFYSGLIFLLSHETVKDPSSGIRLFRKSILPMLRPLPDGLNFIIVMTVKVLFVNLEWRECPVPYHERLGSSKLHVVKDGLRFLRSLLSVIVLNNPFQMYFLGTVFSAILSVYMARVPLIHAFRGALTEGDVMWMIASTFFMSVGVACYCAGVLSTFINRMIFDKKAKKTIFSAYLVSEPIIGHSVISRLRFWASPSPSTPAQN
ncbi:MAG: glycosyltransferase family 2 protein [Candidatus Omnitrophota bacterium]